MGRKYRQRGYQDEDRGPSQRSGRPRDRGDAPRGRGLGAPGKRVLRCRSCGALVRDLDIAPAAECAECGAALHTCTHCRYYDTAAINECRVDEAPPVKSKSKANECEYFEPRLTVESESSQKKAGDAKSEFDSLFDF